MHTKLLRCLMVGIAGRGEYMVNLVHEDSKRFAVAAMVDKTAEFARADAEKRGWKDMPCFGSLTDALKSAQAEAVVITSPAKFHGEQIRASLEAGLHVYVAKPMTYDLDEAAQLVSLAEKKKLCLVVDQQQMHLLTERTMADWVRAKKYGEVGYAEFRIHRYRPEMRAFTGDNPFIWEQGVHSFNSLLAILGRPARTVFAHQIKPRWSAYNGPTMCQGIIEFDGGVPCHFIGTFESREFTNEIRLECEQAAVRAIANSSFQKRLEVALPGKSFEAVGIDDAHDKAPAERFNFDAFYRGCTTGAGVVNDGRDNLRTLAIVDAFIRSSRSGRKENVRAF